MVVGLRTAAVWRLYCQTMDGDYVANSQWENDTPLKRPMAGHRTYYFNHQIFHHYKMGQNQRYLNITGI